MLRCVPVPQNREPLIPEPIRALADRGPGIAAFDADGTLWEGDVSEDFTLWMIGEGHFDGSLWPVYEHVNRRDPAAASVQILQFYRGMELRRLRLLVEQFWQAFPDRAWLPPVRAVCRWAHARGMRSHVVSATPAPVLAPLRRHLPIDHVHGLELEVDERGRCTGRVAGVPTIGDGKAERLRAMAEDPVLLAVGNSVLDIPMLRLSVGVAWAVNPDTALREAAAREGWLMSAGVSPGA